MGVYVYGDILCTCVSSLCILMRIIYLRMYVPMCVHTVNVYPCMCVHAFDIYYTYVHTCVCTYVCAQERSIQCPFLYALYFQHCEPGWESARPVIVPSQDSVDLSSSLIQVGS